MDEVGKLCKESTDNQWREYLAALRRSDPEAEETAFIECSRIRTLPDKYRFVFLSFPPSDILFALQKARENTFLKIIKAETDTADTAAEAAETEAELAETAGADDQSAQKARETAQEARTGAEMAKEPTYRMELTVTSPVFSLNDLANSIHDNAKQKGFWDSPRNHGECIALMHSELSEALEELRKGFKPSDIYFKDAEYGATPFAGAEVYPETKPEGVPSELADCIIRILDFCGAHKIDIDFAVRQKIAYNTTRPVMHGKKF